MDTLVEATALLRDLGATLEHPGYIRVEAQSRVFVFGVVNGPFEGQEELDGEFRDLPGSVPESASAELWAAFVRESIAQATRTA